MFTALLHDEGIAVPAPPPQVARAFRLGIAAWRRGRIDRARRLWEHAATDWLPEAMYNLAELELRHGTSSREHMEYIYHLERGALLRILPALRAGHPEALFQAAMTGALIAEGSTAVRQRLLRMAARARHPEAQYTLGIDRLMEGHQRLGLRWLARAATGGHAQAALLLANTLASQSSGGPGATEPLRWLRHAANLGHESALGHLAEPLGWLEEPAQTDTRDISGTLH